MFAHSSRAQTSDDPNNFDTGLELLRRSIVRLELVRLDATNQPLPLPVAYGQGLVVSEQGAILTAAHNVLGDQRLNGFGRFVIRVKKWDTQAGQWGDTWFSIFSQKLMAHLLLTADQTARLAPNPSDEKVRLPQIREDIPSTDDIAILFAPPEADTANCTFIDIAGPNDTFSSTYCSTNNIGLFVAGSYLTATKEWAKVRFSRVTHGNNDMTCREYATDGRIPVTPGVSGSPLVAYDPAARHSLFVTGVVVAGRENGANVEFQAAFVRDLIRAPGDSELLNRSYAGKTVGLITSWPYERSLLVNYLQAKKAETGSKEKAQLILAMQRHPQWQMTANRFTPEYAALLTLLKGQQLKKYTEAINELYRKENSALVAAATNPGAQGQSSLSKELLLKWTDLNLEQKLGTALSQILQLTESAAEKYPDWSVPAAFETALADNPDDMALRYARDWSVVVREASKSDDTKLAVKERLSSFFSRRDRDFENAVGSVKAGATIRERKLSAPPERPSAAGRGD